MPEPEDPPIREFADRGTKWLLDEAVEHHRKAREEAKMTGAEVLIRQGREEGRKIGREEGREEGKRQVLLELIRSKYGIVPEAAESRITGLSGEDLDLLSKRILAAQTLADLGL